MKTYCIEIDWKPGIRQLWAGCGDVVTTDVRYAFKRKDRAQAERAALSLRYANAKVIECETLN